MHAGAFEADGLHVGDVVRHHVEVLLELLQRTDAGVEGE
jgi:hypothetical protein